VVEATADKPANGSFLSQRCWPPPSIWSVR